MTDPQAGFGGYTQKTHTDTDTDTYTDNIARSFFLSFHLSILLHQNPLTTPLDELIQHHSNIREHEATNVKAEEFSSVAGGKLETDVCRG
jgi:hypothetical protein